MNVCNVCMMTVTEHICGTYTKCLDAVNRTNQLIHASNGNTLQRLDSPVLLWCVCTGENNVKQYVLTGNLFLVFLGHFFFFKKKAQNKMNTTIGT